MTGESTTSPGLDWTDRGPRSRLYDDVYFSAVDGLEESRAVFLQGCDLPAAWAGRESFTIAELGFGTGLNIAALLDLWRRERPAGARLNIFSVEGHLLGREEAVRALQPWRGALGEAADALLAAWPEARRGLVRLDLPGFDAVLDLFLGDVGEALARWSGPADAWFLDGFAPSRNPDMWRGEVLAAVGRLSAPGARLASFTVAGHVRRALQDSGFEVAKRPGFGAKRERLEGRMSGQPAVSAPPDRVLVVGAGIAGAALARALTAQGLACTVVERDGPGAGASGNPAALVTPRFDAGFGPPAELHAQAFARAVALYRHTIPSAILAEGAVQLASGPDGVRRFERLAGWDGFSAAALQPLEGEALATALAEAPGPETAGLLIRDALVVDPHALLAAWLAGVERVRGEIVRLERRETGWACLDASGEVIAEAPAVVLACGSELERLAPGLGLRLVRGQLEFTREPIFTGTAAAWGAYAVPLAGGGALFGASHVRGDGGRDVRAAERSGNLRALAERRPELAARVEALGDGGLTSRAAVRAATPDHMPLTGTLQPGLFVLAGLGGRGFTLAPLLAEHLAAVIAGRPSPLPVDLAARLQADRFLVRANP